MPLPVVSAVAASVSEWKIIHSLTLAATTQSLRDGQDAVDQSKKTAAREGLPLKDGRKRLSGIRRLSSIL